MRNRRMSSGNEFARKASVTGACLLTITGMCLSIAAIMFPSWQVVNLREYGSIHEHGLWLDCTRHSRDGNHILQRYTTISEPLHCVYKFDYDKYSGTFDLEDDNSPVGEVNRHKFYAWHTSTLIMLALALMTGMLSVIFGACSCCYGSLALIYVALTLLTTFLSSVAEAVFFFFSHRADNRFIKGIVATYEQSVGLAFFLEMAACFFHFISFLVALLFAYFSLQSSKDSMDHFSLQRSSRTNVTNLGRSIDFDAPLYPNSSPSIRPVAYSKQEEYERHVAESMPELGATRGGYPSFDPLPGRIRRKSETCV